jgi:DNA-binding NtrC family response regulator
MSISDPFVTQVMPASTEDARTLRLDRVELLVCSGPDTGREITLAAPCLRVGTAPDNDVVLTDRTVSRRHAELQRTPDGLLVRDLGSTNGTFLKGLRVREAFLEAGAILTLGSSEMRVRSVREERAYAVGQAPGLGGLVGKSQRMRELYGLIQAVAPTPTTVLITGESGAGKEQVATTLHTLSGRSGPLVVFDASVTDPEMVRNDLFGHIKGAFTGAMGSREGAFRRANTGTLFIDEIGELPLELQPRLLRVLETRTVVPVGSDVPVTVDVRVIAATHRDLAALVQAGRFRADLYYRLSVMTLRVPPLRESPEDIPLLVQRFNERFGQPLRLTPAALQALMAYRWPGNVRELRNVLERAVILGGGGDIGPEQLHLQDIERLPTDSAQIATGSPAQVASPTHLKVLEQQMIEEAMVRHGHNKAAVARELGIPLSTLKRRLADYQARASS